MQGPFFPLLQSYTATGRLAINDSMNKCTNNFISTENSNRIQAGYFIEATIVLIQNHAPTKNQLYW
jgi:hypothetical protein